MMLDNPKKTLIFLAIITTLVIASVQIEPYILGSSVPIKISTTTKDLVHTTTITEVDVLSTRTAALTPMNGVTVVKYVIVQQSDLFGFARDGNCSYPLPMIVVNQANVTSYSFPSQTGYFNATITTSIFTSVGLVTVTEIVPNCPTVQK
jgi:hypothetical protein